MRPPRGKSGGHVGHATKKKRRQRNAEDSDENVDDATPFRSPNADEDVTDYGLEFTTSRLTLTDHNGQARNSTLRTRNQTSQVAQEHEDQDAPTDYEDEENESDDDEENVENQPPRNPHRSRSGPIPPPERSSQRSQPTAATPRVRRKQVRPINRALRMNQEIARLQSTVNTLIPRLPFSRLVREILYYNNTGTNGFRMTQSALEALQQSSEMFLVQRFQDAYLLTMHRQRVTLEVRDMALMAFFCKDSKF